MPLARAPRSTVSASMGLAGAARASWRHDAQAAEQASAGDGIAPRLRSMTGKRNTPARAGRSGRGAGGDPGRLRPGREHGQGRAAPALWKAVQGRQAPQVRLRRRHAWAGADVFCVARRARSARAASVCTSTRAGRVRASGCGHPDGPRGAAGPGCGRPTAAALRLNARSAAFMGANACKGSVRIAPGTPPRARGRTCAASASAAVRASVPLDVATRLCAARHPRIARWEHPRACGEDQHGQVKHSLASGTPPRVRGRRQELRG